MSAKSTGRLSQASPQLLPQQQQLPPLLTHPTPVSRPKTSTSTSSGDLKRATRAVQHKAVQTDAGGPDDLQNLIGFVLEECRRECLDRRRVFMLKCQIVQLERQLLLMSDAIGARRESTVSLGDRLGELTALCQAAVGRDTRTPEVTVRRADLMQLVEEAGRLRHALTKQADSALNDLHHQSFLIPNAFVRCGSITLKEVAESARGLAFLNLARVGQLEADLADLHGCLAGLRPLLKSARPLLVSGGTREASLMGALDAAEARLEAVGAQLMELSLLVPCLQQRRPLPDLSAGLVSAASGPISRHLADCRTSESRAAIEATLKALASRLAAADAERLELRRRLDELDGERQRRGDFLEATVVGLRAGAREFNAHVREGLAGPLGRVMAAHERLLRKPASEPAREAFLAACREDLPLAGAALEACCPAGGSGVGRDTLDAEAEQERRIRLAFDAAMRDDWGRRMAKMQAGTEDG